ncbi:hypothetical protein RSOLAG1IB_06491 [Rhizoctonia solani AG-1 IB]|uniref:Uncharacterized protein n=1 Tax=Thanatephorus cucumeris (strain AG1-IB / isolate 7/3/14) TaxID=1108050 RepID=A0A0B7F6E7_THACB|nr:hypothetical protein RSOLAG1IB_06491 [Rhizoctonia solani AG-1 IB]
MHFSTSSLVTLAIAVSSVGAQYAAVNPPASEVKDVDWSALPPASNDVSTNAKRFAQGLPPINPVKRGPHRGGPHRDGSIPYHHGGTRVASAPRAQTSPSPRNEKKCNILASFTNGTEYGYITPKFNKFGEYYAFQPDQDESLLVSFTYPVDAPTQLTFTAENGQAKQAYPLFGGIVGYGSTGDDFAAGNPDYAYLGGTTSTPAGSPATAGPNSFTTATDIEKNIESAIWAYDPTTQAITAQWINSDSSSPPTSIVYIPEGLLALTGDVQTFSDTFGPTIPLHFKCVPPA